MKLFYTSRPYSSESKQRAITDILENAVPDRDYYLLTLGAVALAICAIFMDSIAVLIASMIVAPLAHPILALSLGTVIKNIRLSIRSLSMLIISLVVAIVLAFIATLLFGHVRVDPVLISFSSDLYLATFVAVVAGFIAAYGLVRSKVGGAMTGIGIAVSLMPPLVATGVGLADYDFALAQHSFAIFILNVIGIFVGSVVVFWLFKMKQRI